MKMGIAGLVLNNFLWKVLSVGLAIFVWAIIQGEQVLEINREVIVNLKIPEGYMIRGDASRAFAATLKGPRVMVLQASRVLEAELEVPPLRGRKYRLRLGRENIKNLNSRISFRVQDPYFYVTVDVKASRTVPIKFVPHGTTAEGYFVKKAILTPSHVKLTGLKSDLIKIREVVTEPVDIGGLQENKTYEATLIPPAGIQPKNLSVESTVVTLQVGDSFINQRFGSIPIEIVGSDFPARIRPKYASILIQGTPGTLKFVKRQALKAFVEVRGLEPGTYEKEIQVKIPSDTWLIESFPKNGTVIIEPGSGKPGTQPSEKKK